ncbi:unnamed protein product [Phytophthora lilii]|uniref:Unnamed protein product n=1 Tax=Phytophthora lilii TaxID=2077276 RepID=A0A9W7CTU2_9STRA|nr:unnamed protein product [Phytophthora lilii]
MDGPGGYETVGLKRRRSNESFRLWGSAKDTLLRAAAGGHVHVLEWLQANHPEECDTDVMDVAAGRGRLAALKLLHANRNEGCSTDAMIGAAEYGHFETVRWLYENRPESHTCAAIVKAIRGGHLRIAYWLLKKFPDYRVRAFSGEPLRLMNDSIYSSRKPLETLLYLRVVYPESLTPRFIRTIRKDYEDSHPDRTTSKVILSWLNDDFPSTKATVAVA